MRLLRFARNDGEITYGLANKDSRQKNCRSDPYPLGIIRASHAVHARFVGCVRGVGAPWDRVVIRGKDKTEGRVSEE